MNQTNSSCLNYSTRLETASVLVQKTIEAVKQENPKKKPNMA